MTSQPPPTSKTVVKIRFFGVKRNTEREREGIGKDEERKKWQRRKREEKNRRFLNDTQRREVYSAGSRGGDYSSFYVCFFLFFSSMFERYPYF